MKYAIGLLVLLGIVGVAYMDNRRWVKRVKRDSSDEPMWV
jgi:hypothetical protein